MPDIFNGRYAPFPFFTLMPNNVHLALLLALPGCQTGSTNSSIMRMILPITFRSDNPTLFLRGFGCSRCGRSRSSSGTSSWGWGSWSLSRFYLLLGRRRCRCLRLRFATNSHSGKIDQQNQREQKKDPLLHVPSPPFCLRREPSPFFPDEGNFTPSGK